MRLDNTSRLLLGAGVAVGAVGSAGLLVGIDPVPTAGWLVDVAMDKLIFIASGGLLVAGAVAGRWANRSRLASSPGPGALRAASASSEDTSDHAARYPQGLPRAAEATPSPPDDVT